MLVGDSDNEDAAVLVFPQGKALIQTVDFFTPIVDNPYWFGQIAAANSLSDVYAMGGDPFCAMNIVCFPAKSMPKEILRDIIQGGFDKIRESGALLAGGHSVEDQEIKYGLAVSGLVDPDRIAANRNLTPGDKLILTKPLGTGVLATALKAKWADYKKLERILYDWASRLNRVGAEVIKALGLKAATDVTGFGLGGHLIEMARASKVGVELWLEQVPLIPEALELAAMGLIPAGSHANRSYCEKQLRVSPGLDQLKADLVFDAQTSGGLVLAVPEAKLEQAVSMLESKGEMAVVVGRVLEPGPDRAMLTLV